MMDYSIKEEYNIYHDEGWGYKFYVEDNDVEIWYYDDDTSPRTKFKFSRELIRPILLAFSRMQDSTIGFGSLVTTKTVTIKTKSETVVLAPWSEDPEIIEFKYYSSLNSSNHSTIVLGCNNMCQAFIDLFQRIAV